MADHRLRRSAVVHGIRYQRKRTVQRAYVHIATGLPVQRARIRLQRRQVHRAAALLVRHAERLFRILGVVRGLRKEKRNLYARDVQFSFALEYERCINCVRLMAIKLGDFLWAARKVLV